MRPPWLPVGMFIHRTDEGDFPGDWGYRWRCDLCRPSDIPRSGTAATKDGLRPAAIEHALTDQHKAAFDWAQRKDERRTLDERLLDAIFGRRDTPE